MNETKPVYILGVSAFYHDSAAALLKEGEIIAAAQEERFTRKKHDPSFPTHAIQYCLKEAGITTDRIDAIGFYDKPFLKFERLLLTYLSYAPAGLQSFLKAMPLWLKQKIFLKDYIRDQLQTNKEILFSLHHESHAASAFFPSPFEEAAILTMDGVGEWSTTTLGRGKGNAIELFSEIKFPHSLGLLYTAFTYYLGFRVNSGEYKVMGLAPYGEPKYVDLIRKNLIDIKKDGSFKLDLDYFDFCVGSKMTNTKFHKLFGAVPRKPESELTQRDKDIAASIQKVTEEIMVKMANHLYRLTKLDNLCLAGGVALNCVGNSKILKETPFKNIWIQPAAGDAGGALGVALMIWHQYLEKRRNINGLDDSQKGSFLGPQFSTREIDQHLSPCQPIYEKWDQNQMTKKIAQLLKEQKVIGLFQGRMEFGPRALGARSIIADAMSQKMQSILNLKIKFRESFRPFAPSVLEEKCREYFDLDCTSPYMLLVAPVIKDKLLPAVTHVDGSARIQTVSKKTNPLFYEIIEEFYKLTGTPVIINTSFNIRGEPIVCTPSDAYRCFMHTNMDYLVINNYLFDKERQPNRDRYKKEKISLILD